MTVEFLNLSGTRENLDKTIRYTLEQNWDNSNTNSIDPTFQSDTEENDYLARNDNADVNMILVQYISRERMKDDDDEVNGDDRHKWKYIVNIEVIAEDLDNLLLFEDEINRILWENAPTAATRLNKSDASASEARDFVDTEIMFERIEPEEGEDYTPISNGILEIIFEKRKS